jgi:hypothetical protein
MIMPSKSSQKAHATAANCGNRESDVVPLANEIAGAVGHPTPEEEEKWGEHADMMTASEVMRASAALLSAIRAHCAEALRRRGPTGVVELDPLLQSLALRAASGPLDAATSWMKLHSYFRALVELGELAHKATREQKLAARSYLTSAPLAPPSAPIRNYYSERQFARPTHEQNARVVIDTIDHIMLPVVAADLPNLIHKTYVDPGEFSAWAIAAGIVRPAEIGDLLKGFAAPLETAHGVAKSTTPPEKIVAASVASSFDWVPVARELAGQERRSPANKGCRPSQEALAEAIRPELGKRTGVDRAAGYIVRHALSGTSYKEHPVPEKIGKSANRQTRK